MINQKIRWYLWERLRKATLKNYLYRCVLLGLNRLQHVHNSQPFQHLSENDVLAVQVWRGDSCDEELGAIGVGAGVGHAEQAHLVVLQAQGNGLWPDRQRPEVKVDRKSPRKVLKTTKNSKIGNILPCSGSFHLQISPHRCSRHRCHCDWKSHPLES